MARVFIAVDHAARIKFNHGWQDCLLWSKRRVMERPSAVIKIHIARLGEKFMCVVSEVTTDGIRYITQGRRIKISKVNHYEEKK